MSGDAEFVPRESGTRVEVRSHFDHQWARGFEVVEPVEEPDPGYLIRRRSDGAVLPVVFSRDEVREDRPRADDRWLI